MFHRMPRLLFIALTLAAPLHAAELLGLHENSEASPLVPLLDSAKRSIDVAIYEMDDANVLRAFKNALDRGIRVQVVQEPSPLGGKCRVFDLKSSDDDEKCAARKSLVAEVNARGGSYRAFSKELCGVEGRSCFQHGKMAIVDSKFALISSGNFNSTNLCNLGANPDVCNRDYSFVTDDKDTTSALKTIFENDLHGISTNFENLISGKLSDKLTVSPVSLPKLLSFIASAKTSIQVQNQYLHEPQINEALLKAAQRGVKIEVTVSSLCFFERPKPFVHERANRIYGEFADAGISTRFFTRQILIRGKPGYLHSKAILVDDTKAWIGSMNGSKEAATQNREYGLFFDKPEWVAKLSAIMRADHRNAGTESLKQSLACEKDAR